ncbi:MAG: hypothetical protein FWC03_06475 [Treponema sp.]|nr:hypothetical protein [Treponema sp.]
MNRSEFIWQYQVFSKQALALADKARREGLLSLEDELETDKVNARDIFQYGISLVIDGTDSEIINKILSNIIAQDTDEYSHLIKVIKKEAALLIQSGINSRIIGMVLNSYTDLPLSDDKTEDEDEDDVFI